MDFRVRASLRLGAWVAISMAWVGACSLANKPSDPTPATTQTTTSTTTSNGGSHAGGGGNGGSSLVCGDGEVTAPETCDPPASCPNCDDSIACTLDSQAGSAATCDVVCSHAPITSCNTVKDGCCPASCNSFDDADCAVCGNGVLEAGETCDGNCPTSCAPNSDPCLNDTPSGTPGQCNVVCDYPPITACGSGDICCPAGCTAANDPQCGVSVLLVHTLCCGDLVTDVKSKLNATGAFTIVDSFNAQVATPTMADLSSHTVAFVYSDTAFFDPVALGNILADYYDQGGRVVVSAFARCNSLDLRGRFADPAQPYTLMGLAPQAQPQDSLGAVLEPNSPLMKGVTALNAVEAFRCQGPVLNNGTVVARWANIPDPLIIRGTANGRIRVDINFFPASADIAGWPDFWTGDGAALMRNALLFQ